jgi:predicted alpha-1,2-mannosidase
MVRAVPLRNEYSDNVLSGLPITVAGHRGGTTFVIRPMSASEDLTAERKYHYDFEDIRPYRYRVSLDDAGIDVDYAPSCQSAAYSFTFHADSTHYLVLNSEKGKLVYGDDGAVSGSFVLKDSVKIFLYLLPEERPNKIIEISEKKIAIGFNQNQVTIRYGVSFIDAGQARANMCREIAGHSVEEIASNGRSVWNETLSKIKVRGGTDDQKTVFYSCLYMIFERPIAISEDGRYFSVFDGMVHDDGGRVFYTDDWYWDTYRAAHPLRTIIAPQMEMDMVNSSIQMASQSEFKWMPTFPTVTGDNHSMNCNHGIAVVADLISKGLNDFDVEQAYEVCRGALMDKSLTPWTRMPSRHLDEFYHQHGYFPALRPNEAETEPYVHSFEKRQPVAVTLGTSYDSWCLSVIANYLGKEDDAKYFSEKSLNYRNIFNQETRFFHPKDEDGNFIEPFDYCFSGGVGFREAYDENNGWIYRWDVPHNISDLVSLMGGPEIFTAELDSMFDSHPAKSKYEIWKQAPDHSALVGQYSMGNEPCMHIPYLYNYAGKPWKTQKMTRSLLDKWFRNDLMGIPGDEDGGGLSAFAAFSMMGFYPVTPGMPIYDLTSPVFRSISIDVSGGRKFKIVCHGYDKDNKYIQMAKLNGMEYDQPWLTHEEVMEGARLDLYMGRLPNEQWGASSKTSPPSFTFDIDKHMNN